MFNVSIREYFSVLNVSIVCICNTARSKSIPLLCTDVDSYKFSTVHPPSCLEAYEASHSACCTTIMPILFLSLLFKWDSQFSNFCQDFDMDAFERSTKAPFLLRCFPAAARLALRRPFMSMAHSPLAGSLSVIVVLGAVACLWTKKK
jgi:hypothetical protein